MQLWHDSSRYRVHKHRLFCAFKIEGIVTELDRLGFRIDRLVINNVIKEPSSGFLVTKAEQQRRYIELLRERYQHIEVVELPMFPHEIRGIQTLKEIGKSLFDSEEQS